MRAKDKEKILREIIENLLWMAIRYAHGRQTYAPNIVRECCKKMKELYPDFKVRKDETIFAPSPQEVKRFCIRTDWLDDLFDE